MTQHQHQTHPLTRTDLIRALDQEVDRLLQAKHLLAGVPRMEPAATEMDIAVNTLSLVARPDAGKITNVRAGAGRAKRKMSPAARRRISEAQTARWKKFHQQQRAEKKSQVA